MMNIAAIRKLGQRNPEKTSTPVRLLIKGFMKRLPIEKIWITINVSDANAVLARPCIAAPTKAFKSTSFVPGIGLILRSVDSTLSGVATLAPPAQESKTASSAASPISASFLAIRFSSVRLRSSPPTGRPVLGSFGHPKNLFFLIWTLKAFRGNHMGGSCPGVTAPRVADGRARQLARLSLSSIRPSTATMSAMGMASAANKNCLLGSSGPVAPESMTYSLYLMFFASPMVGSNVLLGS
mmetsp:Transcript_16097/g.37316  ORF Transcript_16097/g.37316 Transcript_16097/m.37316 type:complete len:239 (+) Transcript_16097:163-879(+)